VTFQPLTEAIDYVLLAGRRSPGIAEIVDASSPRRWDERRGYALSGATLIFRGVGLARWKLVLRLYTDQDWEDWHSWRELVQRPPLGERARHLEIVHPILEDLGVSACAVAELKQPTQGEAGEWIIEIAMIEYRVPTIALSEPEGAQDRPTDPVDRTIEALSGIVQNGGDGDVLGALANLGGA